MTTAEHKAGGGIAAPGNPADTKAAITGFVDSLKGFRDTLERRFSAHEAHMKAFETAVGRPHLAMDAKAGDPLHSRAFSDYVRRGDESALRSLDLKALSVAVDGDGGYLVSPVVAREIQSLLAGASPIRSVATVAETQGASVEFLVDTAEFGAAWVAESDPRTETGTGSLVKITIPAHEISAMPKATQRLLDDAAFDVEAWIASRVAEKFTRSENAAFVTGNGTTQPKGFLTYPSVAEGSWAWGSLGYVATGAAGAFPAADPSDVLIDLVYALKAGYRQGASWLMNSRTAATVRKMKDADGRYLWAEGMQAGQPAQLLGYPVVIAEDMPDIGADATAIAFGNFKAGYTVVDHRDVRTLRDPFSAKPHVLFYTTKRVGGDVTNFDAIKLLKFAVS